MPGHPSQIIGVLFEYVVLKGGLPKIQTVREGSISKQNAHTVIQDHHMLIRFGKIQNHFSFGFPITHVMEKTVLKVVMQQFP